jgi:hypothetical protein
MGQPTSTDSRGPGSNRCAKHSPATCPTATSWAGLLRAPGDQGLRARNLEVPPGGGVGTARVVIIGGIDADRRTLGQSMPGLRHEAVRARVHDGGCRGCHRLPER